MTGLHGRAERCGRGVRVYLLPGLTTAQRRAVIRRLRQEASRGFGPPLPLPQLAIALGLDRVRQAAWVAVTIVRLHPAVSLVPTMCIVAAMALFVIASSGGLGGAGVGGAAVGRTGTSGTRGALKAPAGLENKAAERGASPVPTAMAGVKVAHGIHARATAPRTGRFGAKRHGARR